MDWIVIFFFLLWYLMVIALIIGWSRSVKKITNHRVQAHTFPVSVVVPVRNEEKNLSAILNDLLRQTLKPQEIIVADDHSTDRSVLIARQFQATYPQIKLVSLPHHSAGKKAALQRAIEQSSGELIVTTDADCTMQEQWLENLTQHFHHPSIKMVAGPVLFSGQGFFSQLLNVEQLVLQSVASASFYAGYPLFCSGANLAFRKQTFQEVSGYEGNVHVASGDDVFLMKKIKDLYPDGVHFCASPRCTVTSQLPESFSMILAQRIRWAGKWRALGRGVQLVAGFVFLFHLFIILLPLLAMNWLIALPVLLILVGLKWLLEGILVNRVARHLQVQLPMGYFILAQLVYPVYVLAVGILSFRKKTFWKGRTISTR
ncbi:MAG: glycosyltransferase [Cyclobacteriaceae bacterium]|nr:glycosyltransferase [Cyclobacteriaceae bacterium]